MDKKGLNLQVSQWYPLRVYPRSEKMVLKRLQMERVECSLPMAQIRRRWSDRVKLVELPIVPMYVFIHCTRVRVEALLKTKGVIDVVRDGGVPMAISSEAVTALERFAALAEGGELLSEEQLDRLMVPGWVKKGGEVMMVDENHHYLYLPELDRTFCVKKHSK